MSGFHPAARIPQPPDSKPGLRKPALAERSPERHADHLALGSWFSEWCKARRISVRDLAAILDVGVSVAEAPTHRSLGAEVGATSSNASAEMLARLTARGFVEMVSIVEAVKRRPMEPENEPESIDVDQPIPYTLTELGRSVDLSHTPPVDHERGAALEDVDPRGLVS